MDGLFVFMGKEGYTWRLEGGYASWNIFLDSSDYSVPESYPERINDVWLKAE